MQFVFETRAPQALGLQEVAELRPSVVMPRAIEDAQAHGS